jgi:hypothetical protein
MSTSTVNSFVRMPHDAMNDMYGDTNESLPKRATSIVKNPKGGKTPDEPRKDDETCMPGCKVQ